MFVYESWTKLYTVENLLEFCSWIWPLLVIIIFNVPCRYYMYNCTKSNLFTDTSTYKKLNVSLVENMVKKNRSCFSIAVLLTIVLSRVAPSVKSCYTCDFHWVPNENISHVHVYVPCTFGVLRTYVRAILYSNAWCSHTRILTLLL